MAIIKETGAQVANANSYATTDELLDYAQARGTLLNGTTAELEALLFKAMDYLERFAQRWQGDRVSTTQALAWPRSGVWVDNVQVSSTEIPRELFYAQLAAAVEANSQDLQPNPTAPVKREKVGSIEIEYTNEGKRTAVSAFSKPDTLIRPLLIHGGLWMATRA